MNKERNKEAEKNEKGREFYTIPLSLKKKEREKYNNKVTCGV